MLLSIKMSTYSVVCCCFSGSDKHVMLIFLLINVKMPTIVGILTFMCRKKSCRRIFFITRDQYMQIYIRKYESDQTIDLNFKIQSSLITCILELFVLGRASDKDIILSKLGLILFNPALSSLKV